MNFFDAGQKSHVGDDNHNIYFHRPNRIVQRNKIHDIVAEAAVQSM
jgi:hypothetical protein